jgi:Ca2+-binding RTX toxin-like protein
LANFDPTNWTTSTSFNDSFVMDGTSWYVDGNRSWAFDEPVDGTLRFEVRDGQVFSKPGYSDPSTTNRSEIYSQARHSDGTPIRLSYDFMMEPGAAVSSNWMVVGQLHANTPSTPPLQLVFQGNDQLKLIGNWGDHTDVSGKVLWQMSAPLPRGQWHNVQMDVTFGANNTGSVDLWFNGQHVVDYNGPLGYSAQTDTYWRQGIYRHDPSGATETQAMQVRNLDQGKQHLGYVPTGTQPTPVPPPESTPVPALQPTPIGQTITGTSGGDQLTGTAYADDIRSGGGNDVLSGKAGNDTLWVGAGSDAIVFNTSPHGSTNVDIIGDFQPAYDTIRLENAVFSKFTYTGEVKSSHFQGGSPDDADDHIWYDRSTGTLYYDADGNGSAASTPFAVLSNKPALTYADFVVI